MRVSSVLLGTLFVCLAPACSAIWGFEDGAVGNLTEAGATSGATSGSGGASSGAPPADQAPDASTAVPDGCGGRHTDPGQLFVDGFASNLDAACTPTDPCPTVGAAIAKLTADRATIYVGRGTYSETLHVPVGLGARIEGRWEHREGAEWKSVCETDPGQSITGMGERTVEVLGSDAAAPPPAAPDVTLAYLFVQSPRATSSGSTYGIFARSASVQLIGSTILAAHGGDGETPIAPSSPPTEGCTAPGGNGGAGSALLAGSYDQDGYVGDALAASPAQAGAPGSCCVKALGSIRAAGGAPGASGGNGGASFAAYLWNARLDSTAQSVLQTLGGGTGAPGGAGGSGNEAVSCLTTTTTASEAGGTGSPGAGGPTACVLVGGTASNAPVLSSDACVLPSGAAAGGENSGVVGASGPLMAVLTPVVQ